MNSARSRVMSIASNKMRAVRGNEMVCRVLNRFPRPTGDTCADHLGKGAVLHELIQFLREIHQFLISLRVYNNRDTAGHLNVKEHLLSISRNGAMRKFNK